jgi:hypothetical protein
MVLRTDKSPLSGVTVPHYVTGAIAFLVSCFLLMLSSTSLLGHYFQPKLLAITHLLVLGWGTMIIFGALYQLIPVILDVNLWSRKLAYTAYVLFTSGVFLLVVSFWNFNLSEIAHAGSTLIILAFLVVTFNLYVSAIKSKHWKIEADFIFTALLWLLFTAVFGFLLVLNLKFAFLPLDHLQYLKAHAHSGFIGWFLMLIMGVSSKLIPMFLLSHGINRTKLTYSYYIVNAGLLLLLIHFFYSLPGYALYSSVAIILTGIGLYASFMIEVYKKRLRKKLDMGMRYTVASFLLLLLPVMISLLLPADTPVIRSLQTHLAMVYGFLIIIGFISTLIIGQTFKTLPFIVWLQRYKPVAGLQNNPNPSGIYSEKLLKWQFYFYVPGIFITVAGILFKIPMVVQAGTFLLFITALLYNINVLKILSHLHNPKAVKVEDKSKPKKEVLSKDKQNVIV